MEKKKFWEIKNATPMTADLYIYGEVVTEQWSDSDVSAQSFHADLKGLGDIKELQVYINSPGGSVFDGQAIYSMIKRHPAYATVHVDGVAASIASLIAMAGDRVVMPSNAMIMIHNPWTALYGNASELRKAADDLDKIKDSLIEAYLSRPNIRLARDELIGLMDDETWLTAQESLDYGLADEIVGAKNIAACASSEILMKYKNVPKEMMTQEAISDTERMKQMEESQKNIKKIIQTLGAL